MKCHIAPCVPIVVSKVCHSGNQLAQHKQQCTNHTEDNTKMFHCIVILLVNDQYIYATASEQNHTCGHICFAK